MWTISIIMLVITIVGVMASIFLYKFATFTKTCVKKMQIFGELLVLLSLIIVFVLNTGLMSDSQENDSYVLGRYMEEVGSAVNRIESNQHLGKENLNEEGNIKTFTEIEKEVAYSNVQIITIIIFTGVLGVLGSIAIFIGRIGEYKLDKLN